MSATSLNPFTVVIPARYGSTRLPGKPLREIAGKPMVRRVYEQACQSTAARVVIATDDQRIVAAAEDFGADVLLTRADHPSGTDRLQEVASLLGCAETDILVNVQGDEPLIPPQVIDQVAANLHQHSAAGVATLAERLHEEQAFSDPNIVKVVTDNGGMARYFSRAPIPFPRDAGADKIAYMAAIYPAMRHIGIYAYRVAQLNQFVQWPAAPLERLEALEQLRFLWHGEAIHVAEAVAEVPGGVDTEADLQRVIALLRENGGG